MNLFNESYMFNNSTADINNETSVLTRNDESNTANTILAISLVTYAGPLVIFNGLCIVAMLFSKSIKPTAYTLLLTHIAIAQTEQLLLFYFVGGILRLSNFQV